MLSTPDFEALSRGAVQADTPSERVNSAYELYLRVVETVSAGDGNLISDAVIDDLTLLVGDPHTNLLACETLAALGDRGRRALPAIEAELSRLEGRASRRGDEGAIAPSTDTLSRFSACANAIRRGNG